MNNRTNILVSEIEDFLYCQRCWYRKVHGLPAHDVTDAMVRGTHYHTALHKSAVTIDYRRRFILHVIFGSALVLLILVILFALVMLYA